MTARTGPKALTMNLWRRAPESCLRDDHSAATWPRSQKIAAKRSPIQGITMTPRLFLIGACLLFGVGQARADLNAETTTPYKLQIVLCFAPNRNMTEVFRTKVAQDVRE